VSIFVIKFLIVSLVVFYNTISTPFINRVGNYSLVGQESDQMLAPEATFTRKETRRYHIKELLLPGYSII
jgi:hypothetical protein